MKQLDKIRCYENSIKGKAAYFALQQREIDFRNFFFVINQWHDEINWT